MSISKETYKTAYDLINKADRILICINNRSTLDSHLAAASVYLYAKDMGKKVNVCLDKSIKARAEKIFDRYGVPFEKKLKPLKYSIVIDHGEGGLDSVRYEDKDGKFSLYITPTQMGNGFNFKNVEFKDGGKYDLIITFGASKLSDLGSMYSENSVFFKETSILNINNSESDDFADVELMGQEIPMCEIVYELVRDGFSSPSMNEIIKLLLMGILNQLQLFNKSDYKISTVEAMTSLVKLGADLKDAFSEIYFDMDPKMINIVKEVLKNISEDEKYGVAWSTVDNLSFRKYSVGKKDFVLDGYVPFNVTDKYKVAFVLYEVEDGEVWIELESNTDSISAKDVLSQFSPSGHDYRALAVVKDANISKIEDTVLSFVKGFIDGKAIKKEMTDSKTILTTKQKTGHNSSSSSEEGWVAPPPLTPSM